MVRRAIVLLVMTAGFLGLTYFFARSLRQRAVAERDAATAQSRATQLAVYQVQLEETVTQRTEELRESAGRLEIELGERRAAEAVLREHDALLSAVTKSAEELLGAETLDSAIVEVLELIGRTVSASRVQISEVTSDADGHHRASLRFEACAPGWSSVLDDPNFRDLDLTLRMPPTIAPIYSGTAATLYSDQMAAPSRALFQAAGMRSILAIPLMVDGSFYGTVNFVDASESRRVWSWAETDTLKTLTALIGAAMTRARYVKALADAQTIVENSPTILYRLRGEPSFPLIYISPNIAKFGHDPAKLMASPNWATDLVEPEDRAKVGDAMAHVLETGAEGATIEFRLRTGDGTWRWVENRYTPIRDTQGGLVEVQGMFIDVTERKLAEDKIALLARTDSLTGLANRGTFLDRLRQSFAACKRGARPFAVLSIDLDRFKPVNDTLGHAAGDQLLREVAERMKSCVREADMVARLGGDEFVVLQGQISDPADAGTLAGKILRALDLPFRLGGGEARITASIGICPYTTGSASPDAMLAQADLALYRSKHEGRNNYHFQSDTLDKEVEERLTLSEELKTAIERNQLELHYQPQIEISSGRIIGMEAMIRWEHAARGIVPPSVFLPIAETTGSIAALGHWVLDRACRQMRIWQQDDMAPPVLAISLSLGQLKIGPDLVSDIATTTTKWSVPPGDLEFDVTEATLAQATLTEDDVLPRIRALGCKIAIADFGTEYSFIDYIRAYRVNHLKIAQSYLDKANSDPERAVTVHAILSLAKELGVDVIAVGVETAAQTCMLTYAGATTQGQGRYFSGPVNAGRATEMLRQGCIPGVPAAAEKSA
jgi:diguanylate cyclase (GGDEF)-like protein/PAS domain S-box-containing protein